MGQRTDRIFGAKPPIPHESTLLSRDYEHTAGKAGVCSTREPFSRCLCDVSTPGRFDLSLGECRRCPNGFIGPLLSRHLRQCGFGLGQPEGHVHGAVHLDGSGQLSAGLLLPSRLGV